MVALAEEVPPRPLNVYLSCSERACALIPAAVEPAPVQKLSKAQKAQRYLSEPLLREEAELAAVAGSKPLSSATSSGAYKEPCKDYTGPKESKCDGCIPPDDATWCVPAPPSDWDWLRGWASLCSCGAIMLPLGLPSTVRTPGNGTACILSNHERSGGGKHPAANDRIRAHRTRQRRANKSYEPHRSAEPRTAHARRRRTHPDSRRTQPRIVRISA